MTDKEKIIAFTKERFIRNMVKANTRGFLHTFAANEDKELLEFIDSMKKEPVRNVNEKATEVDIEKTLNGFQNRYAHENSGEFPSAIEIAKHFHELGLKAKGE